MNQDWFEMGDIHHRQMKNSVWVPLRSVQILRKSGRYGYLGYCEEFSGSGTLAVPLAHKSNAEKLDWTDVGIGHIHSGYHEGGKYVPADVYEDRGGQFAGLYLVLAQHLNSNDVNEWHLHQDFVITMGLKREADEWVCPGEGYIQIARLRRDDAGKPVLLEVRAEHLKDYLCARGMGLYVTSYHSRTTVVEDASFVDWKDGSKKSIERTHRWEGRVMAIHEGGGRYGEKMAVIHSSRTDVDGTEDIPSISGIPTDQNIASSSWEREFHGRKLFMVEGELWRNEWIDPAPVSPRIKDDELPPSVFFIVDEQGNKESRKNLSDGGRWLWFKPEAIMALAHRRGGALKWYTRDTGSVRCSPDHWVHFGINRLGLVNVYAKDVALLPEWQQQIWAGHNVNPEGGVSEELLASQVKAQPAGTQAPEQFLKQGIELVNALGREKLSISIFSDHEFVEELLKRTHRFRAVDDEGLYALAKDVTRVITDNLNIAAIQSFVSPPKGTKWRSLKSLENLIASKIDDDKARSMLSALVGAYELRLADAHLPSSEIEEAFALLNVDRSSPTIFQGYQLLSSCVSSLYGIAEILRRWDELRKE